LLVRSEPSPNTREFPYLLLTVCQYLAQRLGLSTNLVSVSKHPASGPVNPRLILKRVQKVLDPAPTLESSPELFIGAGLARCLGMQHYLRYGLDSCGREVSSDRIEMPLVLIEHGRGVIQEVLTIEFVEETCTAVQGDHDRLASKRHSTQRLSCLLLEGVVAGYPQHKVSTGDLCHREGDVFGTILGSNPGCVDDLNVLKIEGGCCESIAGGSLGADTDPFRRPARQCRK